MTTFRFMIDAFTVETGSVEIEADSLDEAIEQLRGLSHNDLSVEMFDHGDRLHGARAYEAETGDDEDEDITPIPGFKAIPLLLTNEYGPDDLHAKDAALRLCLERLSLSPHGNLDAINAARAALGEDPL